jgi:hypothetical protein
MVKQQFLDSQIRGLNPFLPISRQKVTAHVGWFLWVIFGMFRRIRGETSQKSPIKTQRLSSYDKSTQRAVTV